MYYLKMSILISHHVGQHSEDQHVDIPFDFSHKSVHISMNSGVVSDRKKRRVRGESLTSVLLIFMSIRNRLSHGRCSLASHSDSIKGLHA